LGLTLSHRSALFALRTMREQAASDNTDLRHEVTHVALARAEPWVGERWNRRAFDDPAWRWPKPTRARPLDVLVKDAGERIRLANVHTHYCRVRLPGRSLWWVDECTATVGPELLFVQAANAVPLFYAVLLGNELCGNFSRAANNPVGGPVTMSIPPVTSVDEIRDFIHSLVQFRGASAALKALEYVSDSAVSVPEALLAAVYSLPIKDYGYGMAPVKLNARSWVSDARNPLDQRRRYPDLMLPFAPIGINYDGEDHLDLKTVEKASRTLALADVGDRPDAMKNLASTTQSVRAKYVDDVRRNREFMTSGSLVLPMVKEDLYGQGNLDHFTVQLLMCAKRFFGINTEEYEKALNDYELCRGRQAMIDRTLLPIVGTASAEARKIRGWL